MALEKFNNGELNSSVRGKINGNFDKLSSKTGQSFTGVFDLSEEGPRAYNPYISGAVLNLSIGENPIAFSTATVKVKGGLIGTIPSEWVKLGDEISSVDTHTNILMIMYVSPDDIRFHNTLIGVSEADPLPSDDTEAPSAPTNVMGYAHKVNGFGVKWDASTDNVGVVKYQIYLNGVYTKAITGTSTNLDDLEPGTGYSVTVVALDGANNVSEMSTPVVINTSGTPVSDTSAPTTPGNLSEVSKTATSVNLSWSASTDDIAVVGYKIYVDGVFNNQVTGLTGSVIGLSTETTYSITVSSVDAAGNESTPSTPLSVTTSANGGNVIAPVTNLRQNGAATATQIKLAWTEPTEGVDTSEILKYEVKMDGVYKKVVNVENATIDDLTPNTSYVFSVRAFQQIEGVNVFSIAADITLSTTA